MILRSSVVPPPSRTRELRWKGGRPRSRRGDRGRRTGRARAGPFGYDGLPKANTLRGTWRRRVRRHLAAPCPAASTGRSGRRGGSGAGGGRDHDRRDIVGQRLAPPGVRRQAGKQAGRRVDAVKRGPADDAGPADPVVERGDVTGHGAAFGGGGRDASGRSCRVATGGPGGDGMAGSLAVTVAIAAAVVAIAAAAVAITIADPDPGPHPYPYPDAWRRRHHHGGQGEPVTVCRTPGRQAASGMVRRLPPSSDRLTWSHPWCAWLDGQLLQRVLTPLGRSQERRRIAAVGGAYTLPASRIT